MGEFKDRADIIYRKLIDRLDDEGYQHISTEENNKIVDFIRDQQLEDGEMFERLVKDSINAIDYIRSQNLPEGFQCGECGIDITFGTNAGTGLCISCELERD